MPDPIGLELNSRSRFPRALSVEKVTKRWGRWFAVSILFSTRPIDVDFSCSLVSCLGNKLFTFGGALVALPALPLLAIVLL